MTNRVSPVVVALSVITAVLAIVVVVLLLSRITRDKNPPAKVVPGMAAPAARSAASPPPLLAAGDGVKVGDTSVIFLGCELDDEDLIVHLRVTNHSDDRKVDFISWRQDYGVRSSSTLTDDIGNRYDRAYINEDDLYNFASIYPGQSHEDKLAFERPVGKASILTLELAARNVDLKESIVFRFAPPAQADKE